jgi:hypothetical protein
VRPTWNEKPGMPDRGEGRPGAGQGHRCEPPAPPTLTLTPTPKAPLLLIVPPFAIVSVPVDASLANSQIARRATRRPFVGRGYPFVAR